MRRIAHISDLHFGAADPAAVTALQASLTEHEPDLVLATGDITQSGALSQYAEAAAFFDSLPFQTVIIPGNHDVPQGDLWRRFTNPWGRFRASLSDELDPFVETDSFVLTALNSARRAALDLDWTFGRLSKAQIELAARRLKAASADKVKLVAVHHPFVKGPGHAGARAVGRSRQALAAFAEAGADLLLTGHVHFTGIESLPARGRSMVLCQAGTATCPATQDPSQAYNLIAASGSHLRIDCLLFWNKVFMVERSFEFSKCGSNWRAAGSGNSPRKCNEGTLPVNSREAEARGRARV